MRFSIKIAFLLGVSAAVLCISALPSYAQAAQDQPNPRQEAAAQDVANNDSERLLRRGQDLLVRSDDSDRPVPSDARSRSDSGATQDRLRSNTVVRTSRVADEKAWCPDWAWWCDPAPSSGDDDSGDKDSDDSAGKDEDEDDEQVTTL